MRVRLGSPALVIVLAVALGGCLKVEAPVVVTVIPPPAVDPLSTPGRVEPGRLAYAPDRSTFAPILTERAAYPTQPEANAAFQRYVAYGPPDLRASLVRLFGCRPGAIDPQTSRVARSGGLSVLCATDFLDPAGRTIGRRPVNFVYRHHVWVMQPVDPPRSRAPWIGRERSPRDPWGWLPGRDRYE